MSASPFISLSNLHKAFGQFVALQDINLDIFPGELVCFLGPSGCGKTTLLRIIAGLEVQTRGVIHQAGRDITTAHPAERDYGIVFQSYALFPNLSVADNVAYGLVNRKVSRDLVQQRVQELLKLVGLPGSDRKYPSQLSGGQQQRIALARALATSPGLLLLDEPLSALDALERVRLRGEIRSLQQSLGVTTIMVTHDQEEALSMADRIVVMNHGCIEQVGTPTEIYREPASAFVADFVGQVNVLNGMFRTTHCIWARCKFLYRTSPPSHAVRVMSKCICGLKMCWPNPFWQAKLVSLKPPFTRLSSWGLSAMSMSWHPLSPQSHSLFIYHSITWLSNNFKPALPCPSN